jgi:hypothetical protein
MHFCGMWYHIISMIHASVNSNFPSVSKSRLPVRISFFLSLNTSKQSPDCLGFVVLRTEAIKSLVLRDTTPCNPMFITYFHAGSLLGFYLNPENVHDMFLRNVGLIPIVPRRYIFRTQTLYFLPTFNKKNLFAVSYTTTTYEYDYVGRSCKKSESYYLLWIKRYWEWRPVLCYIKSTALTM